MPKQYDNRNTGALFRNNKGGNDKRPDYTGTINVNGTEFWLSAWIKESKAGMKYMQLSVQPKEARGRQEPQRQQGPIDPDEDIPF